MSEDPSQAFWISLIVLSILLFLVLGLVIVVPKLACLPCPRRIVVDSGGSDGRSPEKTGDEESGVVGPDDGVRERLGDPDKLGAIVAVSRPCTRREADSGDPDLSDNGVFGIETAAMNAAVSSALNRSGGKRSFSISDFRLEFEKN